MQVLFEQTKKFLLFQYIGAAVFILCYIGLFCFLWDMAKIYSLLLQSDLSFRKEAPFKLFFSLVVFTIIMGLRDLIMRPLGTYRLFF